MEGEGQAARALAQPAAQFSSPPPPPTAVICAHVRAEGGRRRR
eukprot:COSAG06_NODE_65594_length_256_cov_1.305732_1_plen_42_part_10